MSVATIASIVNYLEGGTGDPGLRFEDYENSNTRIDQVREDTKSDLWTVHPITVINLDGPHYGCILLVTFFMEDDDTQTVRFGAVDREGQPCAWHEVQ